MHMQFVVLLNQRLVSKHSAVTITESTSTLKKYGIPEKSWLVFFLKFWIFYMTYMFYRATVTECKP
jgi:hypothetical protein